MNLDHLNTEEKLKLLELLKEKKYREEGRKFFSVWKDNRTEYKQHMEFFNKGSTHHQRCFMAANRVGKSESGAYETACHLTGMYPEWWTGKRFTKGVKAYALGLNIKTVRGTIQEKLFGEITNFGTGLVPRESIIGNPFLIAGVAGSIDMVKVKHISGEVSTIQFKTYEQGRQAFEGVAADVIWLDEECPKDIYDEALMRTTTTKGIMYLTFTPLLGMTAIVKSFIDAEQPGEFYDADKCVISATWDDAPHLDEETKKRLFNSLPPHQRDMRSKGLPRAGSGTVYPINTDEITIAPFKIPDHFKRCFGLDVGWNRTAAVWIAVDPDTGMHYAYSEHYMGKELPIIHAQAILERGACIPGCIDPASRGSQQADGAQVLELYKEHIPTLELANNKVEAGIFAVWELLYTGKLKIFANLQNTLAEFTKYSRDLDGKIIKKDDHAMDALRYAIYTNKTGSIATVEKKRHNSSLIPTQKFNGF